MAKSIIKFKDTITALAQKIDSLEKLDSADDKNDLKYLTNQLLEIDDADLPPRTWQMQILLDVVTDLHELVEKLAAVDRSSQPMMTRLIKAVGRSSQPSEKIKEIRAKLESVKGAEAKPASPRNEPQSKEGAVVGTSREEEENKITQQLTIDADGLIILPIVGIRGLGKTALARHVYDYKLKNNRFESMFWVESGESFHKQSTVNSIIQQSNLPPENMKKALADLESGTDDDQMQKLLQQAIPGNTRYLLVLDDVKSVDRAQWNQFKKILPPGGRILITTPSPLVARNTATVPPLALKGLSERDSWSLFEKIVSSSDDNTDSTNEKIVSSRDGKTDSTNDKISKMVEACKGVPFALQILGSLCQPTSPASETDIEEKFLEQLELKYYRELPFPLKLCFAFCSLFSTNDVIHVIHVPRLISLWIGEKFILPRFSSDNSLEYEAVGEEYFRYFYERSIFQDVQEDELGNPTPASCTIHPLMHYLAVFVAKDEFISVRPDGKGVKESSVRHASFDFSLDVSSVIPESIFDKPLLTFFLPAEKQSRLQNIMKMSYSTCKEVFAKFKGLHVLDLHDLGIHTVPGSISNLGELGYLDLSKNNMETLPSSITKLKHLQTLRLSHCRRLKDLPKDLDGLTRLRHLDLEGCLDLIHMPECIKDMTSLRSLSLFMAGHRKSSLSRSGGNLGLKGLANLNKLRGVLEIAHLERCVASEADEAKLEKKEDLQRLILRWDDRDDSKRAGEDDEFLNKLKPPPNLKALLLMGYGGTSTLSHWQPSLGSLVKFSLINCRKCKSLLPLHDLPSLQILELRKLNSLESIVDNIDGSNGTNTYFPSLKKLIISDCPVLTSWWKQDIPEGTTIPSFSCISTLDIQYCPKLRCMPLCVSLDEKLVVISSSVKPVLDTISSSLDAFSKLKSMLIANINHDAPPKIKFTSLRHLHIRECHCLQCLPQGFQNLVCLEDLIIENCKKLDMRDSREEEWKNLKNLRTLNIKRIPKLECLPKGLECVETLEKLHLIDCSNLTCLLENMDKLKSLKMLEISECSALGSLPQSLKSVTSLQTLIIKDCPKLVPRCQPNTGDDWPQIQHIPNKSIFQTSQHHLL